MKLADEIDLTDRKMNDCDSCREGKQSRSSKARYDTNNTFVSSHSLQNSSLLTVDDLNNAFDHLNLEGNDEEIQTVERLNQEIVELRAMVQQLLEDKPSQAASDVAMDSPHQHQ